MSKFVRVLKIPLVPTYQIHHLHLKHDVAILTVTYHNKTKYKVNKHSNHVLV